MLDESLYMTRDFVARALRCKISLYLIRPIGLNSVTWQLNFDSDLDPFESFSAAARQARGIRMVIVDYRPKEQISFYEKPENYSFSRISHKPVSLHKNQRKIFRPI